MKTKWLIFLVLVLFLAAGCSSMSNRVKCASVGAATGAAVGATAGGIFGHNKQGAQLTGQYAAIVGGIGAIVGGITGYLVCEDPPPPAPPECPPPAPVPPAPPVVEKIVLNAVQFGFDDAAITGESAPVLDAASSVLAERGDKKVMIIGHTCSIGPEAYNQTLSERRGEAVKAYLVDKGISATRLMTRGDGEANPIADNEIKDGRMMNRRAELQILE